MHLIGVTEYNMFVPLDLFIIKMFERQAFVVDNLRCYGDCLPLEADRFLGDNFRKWQIAFVFASM